MVKERFADWSRTEEPGYVPTGLPAPTRNPLTRLLDPTGAAAVRRRGRRQPRAPRAPASARWSASAVTTDRRARRGAPLDGHARPGTGRVVRAPRAPSATRPCGDPSVRHRPRSVRSLAVVHRLRARTAVVFHVVLAQNQMELDDLNAQIATEQRTYEQRRLDRGRAGVARSASSRRPSGSGWWSPREPAQYLQVPNAPMPKTDDGSTPTPSPTGRRRSRALARRSRDLSGSRRTRRTRAPPGARRRRVRAAPRAAALCRRRTTVVRARRPRPARPRTVGAAEARAGAPLPPIRLRLVAILVVDRARVRRHRRPPVRPPGA